MSYERHAWWEGQDEQNAMANAPRAELEERVSAVACSLRLHRPDDDPEPGNRCKDCGHRLSWRGPGPYHWDIVEEEVT